MAETNYTRKDHREVAGNWGEWGGKVYTVKPWSNGVASRRKLITWVYLRLRLTRVCMHLRWLAMTCAHFGRDQICTQVKASFSPFGHPTQVNASWVTSINLLLANEIQDMSALKCVFCDSRLLTRKLASDLASAFGHPTQVSTQVQPAPTCDCLPDWQVKPWSNGPASSRKWTQVALA